MRNAKTGYIQRFLGMMIFRGYRVELTIRQLCTVGDNIFVR